MRKRPQLVRRAGRDHTPARDHQRLLRGAQEPDRRLDVAHMAGGAAAVPALPHLALDAGEEEVIRNRDGDRPGAAAAKEVEAAAHRGRDRARLGDRQVVEAGNAEDVAYPFGPERLHHPLAARPGHSMALKPRSIATSTSDGPASDRHSARTSRSSPGFSTRSARTPSAFARPA